MLNTVIILTYFSFNHLYSSSHATNVSYLSLSLFLSLTHSLLSSSLIRVFSLLPVFSKSRPGLWDKILTLPQYFHTNTLGAKTGFKPGEGGRGRRTLHFLSLLFSKKYSSSFSRQKRGKRKNR